VPQVRGNTAEFSENSDSIRSMRIAVIVHERIFVTEMEALPLLPHRAAARGLRLAAEDRCLR
jgi:hypothetical protein